MTYQQIRRADFSRIGSPGRPHYAVDGWPNEALRDLDGTDERFGLRGTAFWPVDMSDPAYDPDTQALTDAVTGLVIDKKGFRFTGTGGVRDLTADEIAARNPVPASISDRQFFQALALRGLISEAEALAAVKTGAIPTQLQAAVDTIKDEAQHFAAVMLISGATVFERAHPMAAMLGQAIGKDSADLDDLWRFGATL